MNNLEDIAKLVGSGELLSSIEKTALVAIKTTSDENLPLGGEDLGRITKALELYILGLQDDESDLFVSKDA